MAPWNGPKEQTTCTYVARELNKQVDHC